MAEQPLSGTVVVEWCELVCGPFVGKWLAEAGADVIKIEAPGGGDPSRRQGPFPDDVPHPERSGLFITFNTNKRSVTLNPATSDGRVILRRLLEEADVFLVDQSNAVIDPLGFDYASMHRLNPRLVMTSVTPYGREGPYASYKAYPLNIAHASGGTYAQVSGRHAIAEFPDGEPMKPGLYAAECDMGIHAAVGTMGALLARHSTGEGQHVDISKQWAGAATQRSQANGFALRGVSANRVTNTWWIGGVVPCIDGYTQWIVIGRPAFERTAKLLGYPAWSKAQWFRDGEAPNSGGPTPPPQTDEINGSIEEYCRTRTRAEIEQAGQALNIPITAYFAPDEVLASLHLRARGYISERTHAMAGSRPHVTFPFRASAVAERPAGPAPLIGEHNMEVYCDRLGYSRADVVRLRQAGVI